MAHWSQTEPTHVVLDFTLTAANGDVRDEKLVQVREAIRAAFLREVANQNLRAGIRWSVKTKSLKSFTAWANRKFKTTLKLSEVSHGG